MRVLTLIKMLYNTCRALQLCGEEGPMYVNVPNWWRIDLCSRRFYVKKML
jgi:hypothetical protein